VWGGASAVHAHDFGPPVGARLPNIEAQDQNDAQQSVGALVGENGLVLLVTRAADWCPFCQRQMIGLEGIRGEIEARGWRLAAITTDAVPELARFAERRDIGYPMLSDEQAEIVRQLDLLDPTMPPNRRHHGLPVPTLLFVSPQGEVLAKLGDADFRVRPTPETVLQTLDRLR
jgi:peroxiredoxin